MISKSTKMVDVIYINHHLISVIHKIGIRLGFGDASVEQVAQKYDLNPNFVVAILNTYNNASYLPEQHLQDFSVEEIVGYLRKSHKAYVDEQLPELALLFEEYVTDKNVKNNKALLKNFFSEYRKGMEKHFATEDETLFPYALAVEQALLDGSITEEQEAKFKRYTVKDFLLEHDDIEVKLNDLLNLIIKYIPQEENNILPFKILEQLYHLNNDLKDHSKLEELVLIPKVAQLEAQLKERKK